MTVTEGKGFQVQVSFNGEPVPVPAALTTFSRAASLQARGPSTHRRLGGNMYPRGAAKRGGCAVQSGDACAPRVPTHTTGRYGGFARVVGWCGGVCLALVQGPRGWALASATPAACVPVLMLSVVACPSHVRLLLLVSPLGPICVTLAIPSLSSRAGRSIPRPAIHTVLPLFGVP